MSLTAEKQATWDTLKGITDPVVKEYANKPGAKQAKYLRIQRALRQPHAMFQPVRAVRNGPGGQAKKWASGLEELVKFMPLTSRD
jgi:hypothetical protein